MHYDETIYRPPPEANTPLLQVTSGCSYNACAFCNMYQGVPFRMQPHAQIEEDLQELQRCVPNHERIYLVNGDPFALSATNLLDIAALIRASLPNIKTISMYASIRNILQKTPAELHALRTAGLDELYIGLESGYDDVLKLIHKGNTASDALEALHRLETANITYHLILMTGLAGHGKGIENAEATVALLNQVRARSYGFTSTTVMADTALAEMRDQGLYEEADEYERYEELLYYLKYLEPQRPVFFWATHSTNAFALQGVLPREQEALAARCSSILATFNEGAVTRRMQRGNKRQL